jgi:hypothetical protein
MHALSRTHQPICILAHSHTHSLAPPGTDISEITAQTGQLERSNNRLRGKIDEVFEKVLLQEKEVRVCVYVCVRVCVYVFMYVLEIVFMNVLFMFL